MKSVMISIKPKWCKLIGSGNKIIEIRKTVPKTSSCYRFLIYCTKPKSKKDWSLCYDDDYDYPWQLTASLEYCKKHNVPILSGKVIGEFICNEIMEFYPDDFEYGKYDISDDDIKRSCLTQDELWEYGKGKKLYGMCISDLVIYDEPKELSKFHKYCNDECSKCLFAEEYETSSAVAPWTYETKYACLISERRTLKRPPQSWCYVEGIV